MKNRTKAQKNNRNIIVVGDIEGAYLRYIKERVNYRYDVGVIAKKKIQDVKSGDILISVGMTVFGEFEIEDLKYINQICHDNGLIRAVVFDMSYAASKSRAALRLVNIKYHRFTPNIDQVIYLIHQIAADLDLASKLSSAAEIEASEILFDLSAKIDNAIDGIEALRLNSTHAVVHELKSVSADLKRGGNGSDTTNQSIDIRHDTKKVLQIISSIFDHVENSRLASLIVSGCVTAMVANSGWSAVACQTVCLASWHGKEAFMAAVKVLPSLARGRINS